jgi:leucyl-tRNA synthetase
MAVPAHDTRDFEFATKFGLRSDAFLILTTDDRV